MMMQACLGGVIGASLTSAGFLEPLLGRGWNAGESKVRCITSASGSSLAFLQGPSLQPGVPACRVFFKTGNVDCCFETPTEGDMHAIRSLCCTMGGELQMVYLMYLT